MRLINGLGLYWVWNLGSWGGLHFSIYGLEFIEIRVKLGCKRLGSIRIKLFGLGIRV